jgi:tRNA dimethylallyltransferase
MNAFLWKFLSHNQTAAFMAWCMHQGRRLSNLNSKIEVIATIKAGALHLPRGFDVRTCQGGPRSHVLFQRYLRDSVVSKMKRPAATCSGDHIETPERSKVMVLSGATAVGKTATSIKLAKLINGEVISADSVQVYRGLDIGSAKITEAEMDGVRHHCIDILDPEEEFSAGLFHSLARAAIEDILQRGKTPIVVGGTGFYLKWLVSGRPSTPVATKESEEKAMACLDESFQACANAKAVAVDELTQEDKWKAGVDLVRSLGDEATADRLLYQEVNNWYRMHRVIDILLQAPGKTLADLNHDPHGQEKEYDFRCFYLVRPRVDLYRRIDERVELMMMDGLLAETAEKLTHLEPDSNCATRAIGYRQVLNFLQEHRQTVDDEQKKEPPTTENVVDLVKDIQTASRQLCHRQMHWFRKEPAFRWVNVDQDPQDLLNELLMHWERSESEDRESLKDSNDHGAKKARLSKEEERELRSYIACLKFLTPGSSHLEFVVRQAQKACALGP